MSRDFLSIKDLTKNEIEEIFGFAAGLKLSRKSHDKPLKNKTLGLVFEKPSNRTRISFEVAMVHLGGYVLYLSPREIKMGDREPVKDVAKVVSRYVDGIVARVFSHDDVKALARHSDSPVVNGLSDYAHPCQALSDLFTIAERKRRFRNATVSYVGDGNNVLNSLLMVCAKTGISLKVATPSGYEPPRDLFEETSKIAAKNRAVFELSNDPVKAVKGTDFIYTDVWTSMGQEQEEKKRLEDFKKFQVNDTLMKAAGTEPFIMHCLPAHRGQEITDIIDGKNSIVYDQAENRMHMQKAILLKIMG